MFLDHREGRAQDVFLTQAKSARETLDEDGLARAEIANQTDQFATFEKRPTAVPRIWFRAASRSRSPS